MDLALSLGQGLGLAVACGLAAFLPLALLASTAAVVTLPGALDALTEPAVIAGAWIAGVGEAVLAAFVDARVRLGLAGVGGGLTCWLASGQELPLLGLVLGIPVALVSGWLANRVYASAISGEGTSSGVALLGAAAAVGVSILALIPFVGYLLVLALAWLALRARRSERAKYAGLRVLR